MTDMADLFAGMDPAPAQPSLSANAPLADRLRPMKLAEVVGQDHLTGAEGRSVGWSRPGACPR